jgi:ectoine hydroxylase-related dioxygenase (phytanoyl-CoA dioxygenase family)
MAMEALLAVSARASVQHRFDPAPHIKRMREDGYAIVKEFLDAGQLAAFRAGMAPHLGTHRGRNPFEGRTTERVYTMVARGRVFEDLTCDARLLSLLDAFLRPSYLLSASHAIDIYPGEVAQSMHFDDSFYPIPRPRPAISMSVIGAIDAFTAQNGGTVIIPRSHLWSSAEYVAFVQARQSGRPVPAMQDAFSLEMPAGAIAVFQGTLVHGAGANTSEAPRMAYTNQYCEPWARTQENFYLSIPKDLIRRMSPRLQSLLGYDLMGTSFMGQVTASHPHKSLDEDWVAPILRPAPDA